MKLVSDAKIGRRLRVDDNVDYIDLISSWNNVVADVVERFLGRQLTYGVQTEYFDGGSDVVSLSAYPVDTITSVGESLATPRDYATGVVESDYYDVDTANGLLYRLTGRFLLGRRAVQVVYIGGYQAGTDGVLSVPLPIQQACEDQVIFYLKRRDSMDIASQNFGQSSDAKAVGWDLLPGVMAMLKPYRRLSLG